MDNDAVKFLGKRIKELRKYKNFTQEKFAELLNIDAKHLSRIECGKTQPSLNLIKKMSNIFDIEISKFFETSHLKEKNEMIFEINKILKSASPNLIKAFYKILVALEN